MKNFSTAFQARASHEPSQQAVSAVPVAIASAEGVIAGNARDRAERTIADWNAAHPTERPFIYWDGEEDQPADWDGGAYLCRDGGTYWMRGYGWRHGMNCWNETADWDRIGYTTQQA